MTTAPEPPDGDAFADLIAQYKDGELAVELAEKLREVVAAVLHTQKAGAITLVLAVTPRKGSLDQVDVTEDVKTKIPEVRAPRVMFADKNGDLVKDDPRQLTFDVQPAAGVPGAVRHIGRAEAQ